MKVYTNQIQILHFSDLHFGEHHICNPIPSASGAGIPDLGKLITDDLKLNFGTDIIDDTDYSENKKAPLIVAITGDFTQKANHAEFSQASNFLNSLLSNKLLDHTIDKKDIFMVPGNHDVSFSGITPEERFVPYSNFYNNFYRNIRPVQFSDKPIGFTQIHIAEKEENKILIAEINCCVYVQKDTIDSSRGQVDMDAIRKLRTELKDFSDKLKDVNNYIKIAIIHHHVVLLPSFIENGRGVDSIMYASFLLELLSENNFHAILHGHKHYPQIFQYEPLPLWTENEYRIPQFVIAGGSCGSNELPNESSNACNTYGVITIKWHPAARQARIKVITRGLKRTGKKILAPDQWEWETVNVTDKTIAPYRTIPNIENTILEKLDNDIKRKDQYRLMRCAFPVIEVMPSLITGQAYEVRAWITYHKPENNGYKKPIVVEWSAGDRFKKQICSAEDNPNFSVSYHYWGSMLIEAKLIFDDGYIAYGYVYARIPKDENLEILQQISTSGMRTKPVKKSEVYLYSFDPDYFDYDVSKQALWDNALNKEVGPKAGGDLSIEGNILNINRTDSNGRFAIILKNYGKDKNGSTLMCIKSDSTNADERKIQISCDVRSLQNTRHMLQIVIQDANSGNWITNKVFDIISSDWTNITAYFRVSQDKHFRLKIFEQNSEVVPSTLQLKNLKIIENFKPVLLRLKQKTMLMQTPSIKSHIMQPIYPF